MVRENQHQPWERVTHEPAMAWESFRLYRDMGLTRSTNRVAEQRGVASSTIYTYSARWGWVVRAAAWDAEQDRLDTLWLQEERRKAVTRHVRQAQTLQTKWLTRLSTLDPNQLSPGEVIRYAEIATKMERDALQLAGSTVDVNVKVTDVGSLSPEEVRQRLELLQVEVRARLAEAEGAVDP
jgi:hypothetical protein